MICRTYRRSAVLRTTLAAAVLALAVGAKLYPVVLVPLRAVRERLADLEQWGQVAIAAVIQEVAADYDLNLGKLGQPIRVAVTGGPVSPPIDVTLWLVGRKRTLKRLDHAIELIEARTAQSSS